MNTAEWIIVGILAATLLIFLIIAIIVLVKVSGLVTEAKKVIIKSQDIAETANDIAENVKGMTSFGKVIHTLADSVDESIKKKSEKKSEKASTKKSE